MSATLYFTLIDHKHIQSGAGSTIDALEKVFGSMPINLGGYETDIPKLEGMAAMWQGNADENPYQKIIKAIEEFGAIRLSASY